MKYLRLLVLLSLACPVFAQSTNVSATVVDDTAQVWKNGTISYTFKGNGSFYGKYQWQGADLPAQYLTPQVVQLDSSGVGAFNVPSNTAITPAGSTWTITVCPDATFTCTTTNLSITGSSVDISSTLTAAIIPITVQVTAIPKAYNDAEATVVINHGGLYFNTGGLAGPYRYWDGTQFQPIGGGGGVTQIIGGNCIAPTPSGGTGAVTLNYTCSNGGITGLDQDTLAGVAPFTHSTTVMVHAVNGTQHLTIDSVPGSLEEYYNNTDSQIAYSFSEQSPNSDGPSAVFELDRNATGFLEEHAQMFTDVGLNFVDDNNNGASTPGGTFWFEDPAWASGDVTNGHYISLQTYTGNSGDDNVQIISGGETGGSVSGGAQRANYIIFPRNTNIANLQASSTFMVDHIDQFTPGSCTSGSGVLNLSNGNTLVEYNDCTLNSITPPAVVDDDFFNASGIVYIMSTTSTSVTTSGNIISPAFTTIPGQLYMALYYGGTGNFGGTAGVWRISPIGATAIQSTQTDVTASRSWGTTFHNTTGTTLIASGFTTTPGGSSVGAIACMSGPSTPSVEVWGTEYTATVNNAPVGFFCIIPNGYFYSLNVTGDIAATPSKWIETTVH